MVILLVNRLGGTVAVSAQAKSVAQPLVIRAQLIRKVTRHGAETDARTASAGPEKLVFATRHAALWSHPSVHSEGQRLSQSLTGVKRKLFRNT